MRTLLVNQQTRSTGHLHTEKNSKGHFFPPQKNQKPRFFSPVIQAKLEMGSPGDAYEKEADRVADQVMLMPDTGIQRNCDSCEEEEKIQQKPLIQRKASGSGEQTASPGIASRIATSRGSGTSLDKGISAEMGSKMGADFSSVKVHTDSRAVQLSQDLGAKAFTVGNDIYFNKDQYNPTSGEGKRLMAHELVHTVQQKAAILPGLQRSCGTSGIIDSRAQCQRLSKLVEGHRFLFNVNCDELRNDTSPTQEEALRSFVAESITEGDKINIHGFASEDGGAEYNDKLSCARALRTKEIVEYELLSTGISASVQISSHGEVTGDQEQHRSVVLEVKNNKPYTEDPSKIVFLPCSISSKTLGTRGACGGGTDFTFYDFPSLSLTDEIIVSLYRPTINFSLLNEMRAVLLVGGGLEGVNATARFAAGTGATHRFGPTHSMSIEAAGTPTFDAVRRATQIQLNYAISHQASGGIIDCSSLSVPVGSLPGISFPLRESVRLKAIIGGTQGLKVELRLLTVNTSARTYEAKLRFVICDDFGVDHLDLYLPGLIPFWILQHERKGFQPYIHELVIDETFRDSF